MKYNFEGAKAGSVLPKSTEYKGNYKYDMKEGTATLEFIDGSRFHGYFKDNEQFYGQFVWPLEDRAHANIAPKEYTGYWKGPSMQGQGMLKDKESIKTGVFEESKLHGLGIEKFINDDLTLKGDFASGILHGQKSEMMTEEGKYIGSVMDGKITGEGIMFYKNGDKYDGYWLDGAFHGKGKYVWANGDTFKGSYKQSKKHGRGLHIRLIDKTLDPLGNGEWIYMYEGDYFEDMRQGHGTVKEQREAGDYEGPRFIEYSGEWD